MGANAERAPALEEGQALRRGSCFEQQEPEDGSTYSLWLRFQMLWEPDRTSLQSLARQLLFQRCSPFAPCHLKVWSVSWVGFFSPCVSVFWKLSPPGDHRTVHWLNFTLLLAPIPESSEVGRSKVNFMGEKNVAMRMEVPNMGTSDDTGALQRHPKKAPSVMSSSVIANVLTLMLCCITMRDTRGK